MSKNRLDESTIRRFMGLAGLQPIGEGFFDRMSEEEEEALAPEAAPEEEMAPPMDDAEAEAPVDDAAPADPAATEAAAEIAQDVATAVADALTDALGQHGVTVDAGAGEAEPPAEEDPMGDMGDMGGLDAEAAPEEAPPMEDEAPLEETTEDDDLTKLESSDVQLVDDEKIVQEVARRVAARLLSTSKGQ